MARQIFITGGTGYLGSRLIPLLAQRGHTVRALVRPGSEHRLPADAQRIAGDALRMDSYTSQVPPADTFVHLFQSRKLKTDLETTPGEGQEGIT